MDFDEWAHGKPHHMRGGATNHNQAESEAFRSLVTATWSPGELAAVTEREEQYAASLFAAEVEKYMHES